MFDLQDKLLANSDNPVMLTFHNGFPICGYPIDLVDIFFSEFKFVESNQYALDAKKAEDQLQEGEILPKLIQVAELAAVLNLEEIKKLISSFEIISDISKINLIRYKKSK